MNLPNKKIVIIGGGVIGCAIAYTLARAGKSDVLLLEKNILGHSTTSQAAGLIGQVRASVDYTRLTMRSIGVFEWLTEQGYDVGWHPIGSLRLSFNATRDAELRRLVATSRQAGLAAEWLTADDLSMRFPHHPFPKVTSAIWCADDGYVEPVKLTLAYAQAAQNLGIEICSGVCVQQVLTHKGKVIGVQTDLGEISCHTVINAAGKFAGKLTPLPAIPVRHTLMVSAPLSQPTHHLPVIRIPDLSGYLRPEGTHQLMIGKFESQPMSYDPRFLPDDFAEPMIQPNWTEDFVTPFIPFAPALKNASLAKFQKGLPTCTPDGEFIVGRVAGTEGLFMASGCNVHGISGSAGLAELLVAEVLGQELLSHAGAATRPARFQTIDWDSARQAAESVYANYYTLKS